jgi:hypothetical protein
VGYLPVGVPGRRRVASRTGDHPRRRERLVLPPDVADVPLADVEVVGDLLRFPGRVVRGLVVLLDMTRLVRERHPLVSRPGNGGAERRGMKAQVSGE